MNNYLLNDDEDRQDNVISVFTDPESGSDENFVNVDVKSEMPILPIRNRVLFPCVVLPVSIGRKSSLRLAKDAERKGMQIGVFCQRIADTEEPMLADIHTVGVVGKVVRSLRMPDQTTTIIIQGLRRIELLELTEYEPYLKGKVAPLNDIVIKKDDKEFN